jgi:hypothetical protein
VNRQQALLGAQTRPHKDVDIIVRVADLPKLRETLADKGFETRNGGTESNSMAPSPEADRNRTSPWYLITDAVEQMVGRERRERVS